MMIYLFRSEQRARTYAATRGLKCADAGQNLRIAAAVLGMSETKHLSGLLKEQKVLFIAVPLPEDVKVFYGIPDNVVLDFLKDKEAVLFPEEKGWFNAHIKRLDSIPIEVPMCEAAVAAIVLGGESKKHRVMKALLPLVTKKEMLPYLLQTDFREYYRDMEDELAELKLQIMDNNRYLKRILYQKELIGDASEITQKAICSRSFEN